MTYHGHIENGKVVLDEAVDLPDGAKVEVVPVERRSAATDASEGETLYDRLKHVIGKAEGLPSDYARNHDHYIHGAPKLEDR
ncbi:MAG: hypothetical protein GC159_09490 [Phycisphaera sp.]|nr:hypothetical protein [Phycisphaera sp.]